MHSAQIEPPLHGAPYLAIFCAHTEDWSGNEFTVDYALIGSAWQAVAVSVVNRVMRTVLQDPSSRVSVAFSTACLCG
jgi:hypothetical protein